MAGPLDLVFGSTPQVAPFEPTSPIEQLNALLTGEVTQFPEIENISNLYQTYMLGALNKAIPGFTDILKEGGADTQSILEQAGPLIAGQIPKDVSDQILRSAAFQSLGAGTWGSPMAAGLTARDLGLTSLDLQQRGAQLMMEGTNAAQRWAQIAGGTILPPSKNMYSPEWFTQFMQQQNQLRQETQQFGYNIAALPDPAAAGISGTIMNLIGAYIGAGRGGGGGGGITPSYGSIEGAPQNPGFGANFGMAYQGYPSQGLGGTLGGWFGNIFNQGAQPQPIDSSLGLANPGG